VVLSCSCKPRYFLTEGQVNRQPFAHESEYADVAEAWNLIDDLRLHPSDKRDHRSVARLQLSPPLPALSFPKYPNGLLWKTLWITC
jgi:hypothetical protein